MTLTLTLTLTFTLTLTKQGNSNNTSCFYRTITPNTNHLWSFFLSFFLSRLRSGTTLSPLVNSPLCSPMIQRAERWPVMPLVIAQYRFVMSAWQSTHWLSCGCWYLSSWNRHYMWTSEGLATLCNVLSSSKSVQLQCSCKGTITAKKSLNIL